MIEDFNVDSGEWFPNQAVDGTYTECVAITVADILGDRDNINYSPDFTYAMTLRLQGIAPNTSGLDPWSAMLSAVAYGMLPMSDANFTALQMGELYIANWQNYEADDRATALKHVQNGCKPVYLTFDAVLQAAQANYGVSMPMSWYSSFSTPNPDGTLSPANGAITYHNVRVVGQKTLNGVRYMIVKPWLGKNYGLGGYGLLSENQFLLCAKDAYVFDPSANRIFSLLGIAVTRYPYLAEFLPALYKALTVSAPADVPVTLPPNVPQEPPVAPVVPQDAPKYDWTSKDAVRHSIRLIADEMGLSVIQKNCLCDISLCESSYVLKAKKVNSPTSIDRGLFQINSRYHPEATDALAYDPEWSTRWACKVILSKKNLWPASQHCWNATHAYDTVFPPK